MLKDDLLQKISSRQATVGIIGLGYVGLPLVLRFGEERFRILGFDIDPQKVAKLNAARVDETVTTRSMISPYNTWPSF